MVPKLNGQVERRKSRYETKAKAEKGIEVAQTHALSATVVDKTG
jgi:uncharacterized protein YegP (UPF0339 family)